MNKYRNVSEKINANFTTVKRKSRLILTKEFHETVHYMLDFSLRGVRVSIKRVSEFKSGYIIIIYFLIKSVYQALCRLT